MWCVYRLTCKINGKVYIGQTFNLKARIQSYKSASLKNDTLIYRAIRKYKWGNFKLKVLHNNLNQNQIDDFERQEINNHNCLYPNGYNLETGGNKNKKLNNITRKKMSISRKGKKGKPLSKTHKQKISKANKGRKHTKEARQKISEAQKGIPLSESHKQKISKAHQGKKGHKHSEKTKEKMRISQQRRRRKEKMN